MPKLDKDYERGYAKGLKDGKESVEGVDECLLRLRYLELGGEYGKVDRSDPYVAGFLDCLQTLGVIQ